jgi:acetoin utilization deacetylase AcuC-like enzyme
MCASNAQLHQSMTTAFISHPACRRHEMGPEHPESPNRLDVITDMLMTLRVLDLLSHFEPTKATREQLLRVHDAGYLDDLERIVPENGYRRIDLDTLMNPKTLTAAYFAAGAAVMAVDLVLKGQVKNAFCNVRPPGHHATRDTAMGFCFFNNVAVAAAHAVAVHGLRRVAILDFDVHHGNGTEQIFNGDARVRLFSLYERGLFPLEGGEEPAGDGVFTGLPAGSEGAGVRAALEDCWRPDLDDFRPELVLVSAGFDAHVDDEMSSLRLVDGDYDWLTAFCLDVAGRHSGGRLVSLLEGGYDLPSLARCAAQHVRQLARL